MGISDYVSLWHHNYEKINERGKTFTPFSPVWKQISKVWRERELWTGSGLTED